MILNFNIPLKTLDGKPITENEKEITLGMILSNVIAISNSKTDAMKFFDWAQALYKKESLNLDRADADGLRKFILDSDNFNNLHKGQLIDVIEKANLVSLSNGADKKQKEKA